MQPLTANERCDEQRARGGQPKLREFSVGNARSRMPSCSGSREVHDFDDERYRDEKIMIVPWRREDLVKRSAADTLRTADGSRCCAR